MEETFYIFLRNKDSIKICWCFSSCEKPSFQKNPKRTYWLEAVPENSLQRKELDFCFFKEKTTIGYPSKDILAFYA
ncbi:hypothetical protein A9K97_gp172 [Tokyovirus A1]|uniref:hypothetical protein n=1 Tax=Tokyovirus A1 TaxID=1826170 RepID=UPI0007A9788B|nr:hypothetical protein A9K97_gp172 [Tokyovirus A1]BAU80179.1 hypothetical protein [Tokyovirus A1]